MLSIVKCKIIELLQNNKVPIEVLESNTNLKKRCLYQYIREISYDLNLLGLEKINIDNKYFSLKISNDELKIFYDKLSYFFSKEERENYIFFIFVLNKKNTNLNYFANFFNVSKMTIIQDIKNLNLRLSIDNIHIKKTKYMNYEIIGNELRKRQLIIFYITDLNYFNKKILNLKQNIDILNFLKKIENIDNNLFSNEYINFLADYLSFLLDYYKNNNFLKLDLNFDDLSKNFMIDKNILDELANILHIKNIDSEMTYLNALFISGNHKKNVFKRKDNIFYLASYKYFNSIEIESFLFLENKDELIERFVDHLFITYFRLKYLLYEKYENIHSISLKYKYYFDLAKYNIYILENELDIVFDIPNIILVSLYIISNLAYTSGSDQIIEAILVISNNDIYSKIWKSEIESNFLQLKIIKTIKFKELNDLNNPKNYLLISNHDLSCKNNLVIKDIGNEKQKIIFFLNDYLKNKNNINREVVLFNEKLISIIDKKLDWKKALELSIKPLILSKYVNKNYVSDVIKNIEKYGPYIIIDKDVAIPHASFTTNSFKQGFSITLFKKPFFFPNDAHPIKLLISFSINNSKFDKNVFDTLMTLLANRNNIELILKSKSVFNILEIINKVIKIN